MVSPGRRRVCGGLVLLSFLPLAGCGRKAPRAQAVPRDATVLALGDSLTSGVGASADTAYPAVLQRLTGWKVVNAGVPGDTSTQALARLPGLLQQHQPALVIVSIGGNDFLRRQGASTTRAQVRQICELVRASGAQVLLVAVPELSLLAAASATSAGCATLRWRWATHCAVLTPRRPRCCVQPCRHAQRMTAPWCASMWPGHWNRENLNENGFKRFIYKRCKLSKI